eukprot:GEMP01018626.1.p1 GENE.GEMP01018626.1~~GEMP01018626.1.p1  ORF type:complete len:231 (+),score=51.45 GEMP01018626.1:200-892(+)
MSDGVDNALALRLAKCHADGNSKRERMYIAVVRLLVTRVEKECLLVAEEKPGVTMFIDWQPLKIYSLDPDEVLRRFETKLITMGFCDVVITLVPAWHLIESKTYAVFLTLIVPAVLLLLAMLRFAVGMMSGITILSTLTVVGFYQARKMPMWLKLTLCWPGVQAPRTNKNAEVQKVGNHLLPCAICLHTRPMVANVPCGHLFCEDCGRQCGPICSMCREPVSKRVPLYAP